MLRSWFIFLGSIFLLFQMNQNVIAQESLPIRKITIQGNTALTSESLLKLMNSKASTTGEKVLFWKEKQSLSVYTLEEDLNRLKKHYQKNGFLNPKLNYQIQPSKNNKWIQIRIQVTEGSYVTIGEVSYSIPNLPKHHLLTDSVKKTYPLKSGQRFKDADVQATEKRIIARYHEYGFPYVDVKKDIQLHFQQDTADVRLTINPGNKSYFGNVSLEGDSLIPRNFINKRITIKEGSVFSQKELEKVQSELFDLELFRYVIIRADLEKVQKDAIPISILVKESPRWTLKTGLGYGTEDRIRMSLLLKRLNFLGGARSLTLKGRYSYFVPLNIEAQFIQPDIWFKDLDFTFNPFFSREREESFTVDRRGMAFTFQQKITDKSAAFASYAYGRDKVLLTAKDVFLDDKKRDNIDNTKSGITLGYNLNTTNDLFSPSKGFKTEILATFMGLGFQTQYNYTKLLGTVSYFKSLTQKVVIAGKLKGGLIEPIGGDKQTPIEDRFLIGGAMSLRGWGRNQISPVNNLGNYLGGNAMLEASAELRFTIYNIFSGTTFMDFGNVWETSGDISLNQMHYDAGIGIRIKTPVGPIRFDIATPLFEQKFRAQFFISVGHAF